MLIRSSSLFAPPLSLVCHIDIDIYHFQGFVVSPISRGYYYYGHHASQTPPSSSRCSSCNHRTGDPLYLQNGHQHDSAATPPESVDGTGQLGAVGGGIEDKQAGETGATTRRRQRNGGMFDDVKVPVQTVSSDGSYTAVLVVPTGIGAAIGGYAGDALPVAR